MYELMVEKYFAAAHQLRNYEGSCEHLHGHNWLVQVVVKTERLNNIGLGIDFKILKKVLNEYLNQLDHTNLNDLPPFQKDNPSSENIARWLYEQMSRNQELKDVKMVKVSVWESDNACASYYEE